ncbi:HTH DNA binding protein [Mycobacterium phage Collard]|uniref:Uncharacterized protein n=1 Tax=Mycobacterium phage Collard TaxID=2301704 RepID=A0A385DX55_9CAUD|nr:HTH DNA binding protein [Mycobacterium phage Collard]AXQ63212.1 hypothetical protein SEA_COLLARD_36 [Mycobacterium phage Collard]UEM46430.1 hypothetical protein SEA_INVICTUSMANEO_36 [Mycobacterium phage InvictusManeo]
MTVGTIDLAGSGSAAGGAQAAILSPTSERTDMVRGKRVRLDGRDRTIPGDRVQRYEDTVAALTELYAGPHHAHELKAAIDSAARYLIGDEDAIRRAGEELAVARQKHEAATAAARTLVVLAASDGATEVGLAADLGIDRLTVRKYRGKKDRR